MKGDQLVLNKRSQEISKQDKTSGHFASTKLDTPYVSILLKMRTYVSQLLCISTIKYNRAEHGYLLFVPQCVDCLTSLERS